MDSTITNQNISNSTITNNVTQVLAHSYQYKELLFQLKTQQKLYDRTPEVENQERLEISTKINELKNLVEQFKEDVLRLAEQFNRIEINTDRLKRAKEHFDKGEIGEARAVLESELEQMNDENNRLIIERDHYQNDVLPKLINNSEEFLLLALSTQTNYNNPNWFEDTCQYFERSIKGNTNERNTFQFALFLQKHNQFKDAETYYELYLNKFSTIISVVDKGTTLNNLGVLQANQNKFDKALASFEESLKIRKQLANNEINSYSTYVAKTLNNLANLHSIQNEFDKAFIVYEEALQIDRKLAEINPNLYLQEVAGTLNNLANLLSDKNEIARAITEYQESLKINRMLAANNPDTYLPEIARTLNNLGLLYTSQNQFNEASDNFEEALKVIKQLSRYNPNAYLPRMAEILNNLGRLSHFQNELDKSELEFEEVLRIRRRLSEVNYDANISEIAVTLNNLANLYKAKGENENALKAYEESTKIFSELINVSFQTYFPNYAMNLSNLALFYQSAIPNRNKSIEFAVECIKILFPYTKVISSTQSTFKRALLVLKNWQLNDEEINKLISERKK